MEAINRAREKEVSIMIRCLNCKILNPENAKKAQYAFAIYGGIIQEVYTTLDWYKGGQYIQCPQ